jgi:fucose 4-O-acetylase-like acetyltransferase
MPASDRASAGRLVWLDYAKAIGIMLVVFGHASRSIGRTPGLVWSPGLEALDGVIYAFHMPLFFMLAGFAAGLARTSGAAALGRSLLWGVAVPYLVWSTVWIGLKIAFPEAANVAMTAADLAGVLVRPVEHMRFLYHLFFMRLGWFAIERLGDLGTSRRPVAIIAALALAWAVMELAPGHDTLVGFLLNFALYGFGLAVLPMLLGKLGNGSSLGLVALGALSWVAGLAVPSASGSLLALVLPALGGSLIVVALARVLPPPETFALRLLAFLGEASLAIYVLHLIVGAVLRVALAKAGLLSEPALLAAATAGGLALPALACALAQAAATASGRPLVLYLGLGTATRSRYWALPKSGMATRAIA